ncbi:unnamed protein product [Toxocara canis]|uniref:DNA polymerase alpha subunit B OB domain-containing protein n=1 Tax=Toxocara canis TaxID=6265 RepID=A0A3P7F251_TOXCA|nr:unnamed protein product [Toxocara canis]
MNELVEFSFFPGKVVALKGISENGSIFVPVEVFEPKKMQLSSIFRQPGIGRLHIWCAAGPFTSDDSFSYEQLCDLLDLAKQHQPHVLILVGF